MNTLKDRGNLPFNQATPQESTGPIDSLTDCLRRCTATGDFQTQESLVKIILSATATAQRLISLKEERIPTDTKLKDLEQANSDSIDQIKLLNAKNRALKDSKLELQLSANWYKERLVESQLAEKERFHAEKILNSRLSKALMREEKLNKNLQEIRLSFGTFVKKLAEICNLSEIEGLLDDNLREWIDLGDFGAGTYEESFLARESAQAINDLSREIGRGVERFQTSRAGMRVSKQSEISVHTTRTNHQYTKTGDVEPSLSSIQDSEGGSYYQNVQWADSDNSDGRHRPDEERGYVNEFRINEAFNNHPKVQTRGQAFNNGLQAKNVFRDPITNLGTRVRSLTAEEINPTVWKASPDEIPGSWNDVPTPPELLKKKNVVVKKENCGRVIKLTRLPMEITTAMLSTFVRGGKVEEIRIIAADKSNSYKQALITFCKPESATKFFNWVQEHPGSLVVDGLRCHAVVGVTTEPRVYDLEVRVLLLSRLPEVVNSINKLREFVQQTSHDDDGHPFTIQSQKLYFNGGGSKISASVVFNSIEGAIHMKKKWEVSWGMNIEWGRDECEEGRLLDMDPQMKFFWFTQPKPSGLQYD